MSGEKKESKHYFSYHRLKYDQQDLPLHPDGVTTLNSKLWKIGPNHAADALVTKNVDGVISIALITRKDNGKLAVPGGFLNEEKGVLEDFKTAAIREFTEECLSGTGAESANQELELAYKSIVHQGTIGDSRDSIHRWIETTAFHFNLLSASTLVLKAGDDAQTVDWYLLKDCLILPKEYYHANHKLLLEKLAQHLNMSAK